MAYCGSLPREFYSLQIYSLHKLAHIYWGTLVLPNEEEISTSSKIELLVIHRDKVVKNVQEALCSLSAQFSSSLPKLLMHQVIKAVFNLQQGYYQALVWEEKYRYFLPFTILDPLTAGTYQASYFIEPTGYFNDLAWVKLFVTDERMDGPCRFKMACFYCLEDVLSNIWYTLDSEKRDPFEICRRFFESQTIVVDLLVLFWACKVGHFYGEPGENLERKLNEIRCTNLEIAISAGHEHALRYFWALCSDSQKENFLKNFKYELVYFAACDNLSEIVHFLYALLTLEHKNTRVFRENLRIFNDEMGTIWSCLLNSPFYKCTLNDILTYPEQIPESVYLDIFKSLLSSIEKFNYSIQKTIFKTLWKRYPKKENMIRKLNLFKSGTLIKLKKTDLIEVIIQPIRDSRKDFMLLKDWQYAGISMLCKLAEIDDYDTMLRYLILFLLSENSSTKKISLRVSANTILENLNKDMDSNWFEVDDLAKKRIGKVTDSLNEGLSLLNDVINKLP